MELIGENVPKQNKLGNPCLDSNCQAQPQFQLSWADLALFFIPPAARPATHSPEIVVNKQEIGSTGFVTFAGLIKQSTKQF